MKRFLASAAILASTALLFIALLHLQPFDRVNAILDRIFGAPPSWTQVTSLVEDPSTHETSHSERPQANLDHLAEYWRDRPHARRVVFLGNSQMMAISLAPGEPPPQGIERTYFDRVSDHFRKVAPDRVLCYRLSAPALSYSEALWYVLYMIGNPHLRPDEVILQLNYQAFWNGNIRDGVLELLAAPEFQHRIESIANSSHSYAEYFSDALKRYAASQVRGAASGAIVNLGSRIETAMRAPLNRLSLFDFTAQQKDSFMQMLYRARLYFLRMKPSTARSISGPRLLRSQAALEALAEVLKKNGIRLVLFTAPLNPRVSLYRSQEDRAAYRVFVWSLADRFQLPLYDLEDTVAAQYWGRLLNGPDPLHMGRQAQELMANKMIAVVQANLPGE